MPSANKIDHARVRELLAKGLKKTQVAQRLGCAKSAITRIAKESQR